MAAEDLNYHLKLSVLDYKIGSFLGYYHIRDGQVLKAF